MSKLSHFDESGRIKMVDVGDKASNDREAIASARVNLNQETLAAIRENSNPKGDPLEIARIAGILGAKKTSELIPLCHQINLSKVEVEANIDDRGIFLRGIAKTNSKTGVEMEALTAVAVAGLTIYDMCKAIQKDIEISEIRLESKIGGKSIYRRDQ